MEQNLSSVLTELDLSNEVLKQYFAFEETWPSVRGGVAVFMIQALFRDDLSIVLLLNEKLCVLIQ